MLAAQLTWLANRSILNLPEDRRHGRFVPKIAGARLIMPNGTNIGVRIIDISLSGAGIGTQERPEIGSHVTLGKIPGRVVRHLEDRLRDRVHAAAASGLGRRERDRTVNAAFRVFPAGRRSRPLCALPHLILPHRRAAARGLTAARFRARAPQPRLRSHA